MCSNGLSRCSFVFLVSFWYYALLPVCLAAAAFWVCYVSIMLAAAFASFWYAWIVLFTRLYGFICSYPCFFGAFFVLNSAIFKDFNNIYFMCICSMSYPVLVFRFSTAESIDFTELFKFLHSASPLFIYILRQKYIF